MPQTPRLARRTIIVLAETRAAVRPTICAENKRAAKSQKTKPNTELMIVVIMMKRLLRSSESLRIRPPSDARDRHTRSRRLLRTPTVDDPAVERFTHLL